MDTPKTPGMRPPGPLARLRRACGLAPLQAAAALAALAAFGACCLFLYHKQSIGVAWDDAYPYVSDLPVHLGEAFAGPSGSYSLNALLYYGLHLINPHNNVLIALFLAATSTATVLAAWALLRRLAPGASAFLLFWLALACCLAMAVYIPGTGQRYFGTFTGNFWHNHTYTTLKLFATLSLVFFVRVRQQYQTAIPWKNLALFTLFFTLATWAKPNFFTTFAPAIACMLLADVIKTRGKSFPKAVVVGCGVLCSVPVLLFQSMVLYGSHRPEEGIVPGLTDYFAVAGTSPVVSVLRSLLFPILAAVLLWPVLRRLPLAGMLGLNALFAFGEMLFLIETGGQATHYNLLWGAQLATFSLFLLAAAALAKWQGGQPAAKTLPAPRKAAGAALWATLAAHTFFGGQYFVLLLLGTRYTI